MTKTKSGKPSAEPELSDNKKDKLMTLLWKISFVLFLIAIVCLFAGIYDLGFINLTPVLSKYAAIFLGIKILTGLSGAFAISQISSTNKEISKQNSELLSKKMEEKIAVVEGKVEEFLGENYKKLNEENSNLKVEFDQIKENANNKIIAEIQELRNENADLRKKLDNRETVNEENFEQGDQLQVA